MKLLPFAAAAALIAGPLHAAPSAAEKQMAATVAAEQQRNVALLEKLVNVNSGTLNLAGVTEVGALVRPELDALGFETRWIPMADAQRAGHLVAVHKGNGRGKRLLLIGHLDTVFEKDSPFQAFIRRGDKGEGPGASDNKGGVVVMLAALRAMQAAGTLKNADIEVVLTGDEEDVGTPIPLARRDLIAAGKRADAALDFEGLSVVDGKDMGSIARRSSTSWTLTVTARGGHSSGIFGASAGNGAVYELARIIDTFRRELPEQNLTFNVGLVLGGAQAALDAQGIRGTAAGKSNIIAEQAIARGDMRTLSNEQTARVRARMQAIVDQPLAGAKAAIRFEEGYPAMAPTDGNRALLAMLNGVNRDLGLPEQAPLDPLKRGAGDIAFVAADVAGLVGLGPSSEGDHAPGETVDLDSFERQATRAAVLMSRLAATPR
ncbi:M20/M25/M40 family metallo-hydrolase [Sphingomonas flavalba]|uniref:M20/M25/M40 family metallo-hydrolase n=1 Tax=Sphingomonas flavalba TaxID=2559804 RepID=UPI0039DF74C2